MRAGREEKKMLGQTGKDEFRPVYERADFPGGFVRGKYALLERC
jgi:hypothetical protein